jgi:hypothetical protein
MFERFGVAFWNDLSCQELRRFGQRDDERGFDGVWLADSYCRSIPPVAAAIGCDTRRIHIALRERGPSASDRLPGAGTGSMPRHGAAGARVPAPTGAVGLERTGGDSTTMIVPSLTASHSCDAMTLAAAPSRWGEP